MWLKLRRHATPLLFKAVPKSLVNRYGPHIKGKVLLIRLDRIGDYLLFRNFIGLLKGQGPFQGCHLTLLGNVLWKDLAQSLDKDHVDAFIWIDRDKFDTRPLYRYKTLRQIRSVTYETAISPVYSRDETTDTIADWVCAQRKIGNAGDLSNLSPRQKLQGDRYYTTLIPVAPKVSFEFCRNRVFFEKLLARPSGLTRPEITLACPDGPCLRPFALLFIGASEEDRQWPAAHFLKVAQYLYRDCDLDIIVCGGPADRPSAREFARQANFPYKDLVGKTRLSSLILLIRKARLVISNETMAPHLAVALNVPHIFVLFNGKYLGRFAPYPKALCRAYHLVTHPKIDENPGVYKKMRHTGLKMKEILPEKLIQELKNLALSNANFTKDQSKTRTPKGL